MFDHPVAMVKIGLGRNNNCTAFIGADVIGSGRICARLERDNMPDRFLFIIPAEQSLTAADGHFAKILRGSTGIFGTDTLHGQARAVWIGIPTGIYEGISTGRC